MTMLRDRLERKMAVPPGGRPTPLRTIGAAEAAKRRISELTECMCRVEPPPFNLREIHARISETWRRTGSLDSLAPRDLRELPHTLFYPRLRSAGTRLQTAWLGSDPALVPAYGRTLEGRAGQRAAVRLLQALLGAYPKAVKTFTAWLRLVETTLNSIPWIDLRPRARRWRERCRRYDLLREDGPTALGRALADETAGDPSEILKDAGLEGELAKTGVIEVAALKYLEGTREKLAEGETDAKTVKRLTEFLSDGQSMRFESRRLRVKVAETLLDPFRETAAPEDVKRLIRDWMSPRYGNPMPGRDVRWSGVEAETKRVMRRWLSERSLEIFFMIVEESVRQDPDADRQWQYRKAFWKAALPHGPEIEFVLSAKARRILKELPRGYANTPTIEETARITGGNAVLLIGLPGVTIAEWSNAGAARCWLTGSNAMRRDTPRPYSRERYTAGEIRQECDHWQSHHGSTQGRWQQELADWIEAQTGTRINWEVAYETAATTTATHVL